jgi:hypothetical protein
VQPVRRRGATTSGRHFRSGGGGAAAVLAARASPTRAGGARARNRTGRDAAVETALPIPVVARRGTRTSRSSLSASHARPSTPASKRAAAAPPGSAAAAAAASRSTPLASAVIAWAESGAS